LPGRGDLRQLQDSAKDTLDIYLIGKQWMWNCSSRTGGRDQRAARPGEPQHKVDHGSEDVIHDFYCRLSA